jgi:hypothetical protein
VRAGAPDRSLTANAGLAAVSVLCDRLGVIEALEARSARSSGGTRGLGAGAADRDRGGATGREDFVGPDHQRADAAGQRITPVPGRASRTARGWPGGSLRRIGRRWRPTWACPAGCFRCCQPRSCWPPICAAGPMTRAQPRRSRRAHQLRDRRQADPRRCGGCWPASPEDDWHDAIGTDARRPPSPVLPAMVAGEHPAADTPGGAGPAQVSAGPRSRRRPTLHSDQRPADPRTGHGGPGRWGTDERERYVLAGGTCVCDRRTAKDELTSTESGDRRV